MEWVLIYSMILLGGTYGGPSDITSGQITFISKEECEYTLSKMALDYQSKTIRVDFDGTCIFRTKESQ